MSAIWWNGGFPEIWFCLGLAALMLLYLLIQPLLRRRHRLAQLAENPAPDPVQK